MTPKNVEKLVGLFTCVCDPVLLSKVRESKEFKDEREILLSNLEGVLLAEEQSPSNLTKTSHCAAPQCHQARLGAMKDKQPPFPGSDFCAYHHFLKYDGLLREPDFAAWTSDEELRNILNPFLVAEGQEKCLAFQVAVEGYASISNAATRKARAPKLFSKFMEVKELQLDGQVVKQIKDTMDGNSPLSKSLFQPAADTVRKRMEKLFAEKFLKTKEYQQWAVSVTLPEAMAAELRRKLDEQTRKLDDTLRDQAAAGAAGTDRKTDKAT